MFIGVGIRVRGRVSSIHFAFQQWQLITQQWQTITTTWN